LHKTIKKVSEDLEFMKFNTAISSMMEFVNAWQLSKEELDKKLGLSEKHLDDIMNDPQWFYEKMDSTNDGLMNAFTWRLDNQENILNLDEVLKTLEDAVKNHPRTLFIACHLANQNTDLEKLGRLLDLYPNLYADISARYSENAPVPRYTRAFFEKYQDRLLYGTDMGFEKSMYETTFRILESNDEHFYNVELFGYHWPLYGFGLNDKVLEKLYNLNEKHILIKIH
jgi:hypothetical protein